MKAKIKIQIHEENEIDLHNKLDDIFDYLDAGTTLEEWETNCSEDNESEE